VFYVVKNFSLNDMVGQENIVIIAFLRKVLLFLMQMQLLQKEEQLKKPLSK
jgi:hypothetical protein